MKLTFGFGKFFSFVSGRKEKSTTSRWFKALVSSILIALMMSSINGWTADPIAEFGEDYGIGETNEFTQGKVK